MKIETYAVASGGSGSPDYTRSNFPPSAKAAIFNTALPAIDANWLADWILPTNTPSYLLVSVLVGIAGLFKVVRKIAGVEKVSILNENVPLIANCEYIFAVEWRTGDSINFRYSATGADILVFRADEVSMGGG